MAFPTIETYVTRTFTTTTAVGRDISLPATNPNDLILVIFSAWNGEDFVLPTGWTQIAYNSGNTADFRYGTMIMAKKAVGDETNVFVGFGSEGRGSLAGIYVISGWSGDLTNIELATQGSIVSSLTPPSLTTSWASDDNLWIAFCAAFDDNATYNTFPVGYSGTNQVQAGAATNESCELGVAHLFKTGQTEAPSEYVLSESEYMYVGTMAIKPGTSGGVSASIVTPINPTVINLQPTSARGTWQRG